MSEQHAPGRGRHFRRLLPTPGKRPPSTLAPPPPKQVVACNACRKQKIKCSGEQPACRRCAKRHVQCHYARQPGESSSQALQRTYDDLRDRATAREEILYFFKNLPEQDAQDILRRLRSGTDIETIVSHVKTGDVLLQMAVSPETRFRYEFPYRSELPQDYIPDNPYLDSLVYEAASLYSKDERQSFAEQSTSKLAADLGSDEYRSLYLKPFHAAQVVDPLLSDVTPSSWTAVCDDDVLMRDLLGRFLQCEYHFSSAFQKDYFLEDMAEKREDFCSSLLVNIILAYSCVCYPHFPNRAEYWNPKTLQYRFLAEAKRIWELEATEPRITTIQAGILFNVFHNLCGLDEIGQAYRIQAISLAHRLRLFSPTIGGQSDRTRNGRAFTAWALYNWETLVGFSFMFPPLLKESPGWPLPDPSKDSHWYGEVWIKYPLTERLSPSYFGQVFKARSHFRIIMNEFCREAWSKDSSVTIGKANAFHSRLRDWYNDLPGPLLPRTIVLPGQLQLHLYYHHLVLTMYEPLLDMKTEQDPSPQQVVSEARKYLHTLVRLYYLRHGYEAMDLFIVIPLMVAGFECIAAIDEQTPAAKLETLRSTLILVAKGLSNQRRNHYLAEALFRVIRGRMRPQEVVLLRDTIKLDDEEDDGRREMVQAVRSHWPVSVVRKKEDMDSHILANLVDSYAHLNVEASSEQDQGSQ